MTAEEARKQTDEIHIVQEQEKLKKIESTIGERAKKGFNCVSVKCLSDYNRKALEQLGYEVKHYPAYDPRDSEYWRISW